MDFASNRETQHKEMLQVIGVRSFSELIAGIPDDLTMPPPSEDDGLSEFEGMELMKRLAARNGCRQLENYRGAGAYEHHIPACVGPICQKSEFLTSYTPYQPECSQGMLQVIFEFQSAIAALTGLDVANASLYDAASACAEGLLMTLRQNRKRNKVLVSQGLHPHYRKVVEQYLSDLDVAILELPCLPSGSLDVDAAKGMMTEEVAGLLLQSPNVFGIVEDCAPLFTQAKTLGILTVLCANPMAYGLFKSAAELGADIAVGDTQPFGLALSFGGPYCGYLACTEALTRQIPGRIVGETVDADGRRGFVLTLQAREQHIRREKATSNICSNQALAALASLIAILWYGRHGVKEVALANYQKANYLRSRLATIDGLSVDQSSPIFNEFVVCCKKPLEAVQEAFFEQGIDSGVDLKVLDARYEGRLLVTVT
ncbi:MAG: aminomethyl-transferring glycine dehydrogenase subunit GcvPA, partial [Chlamydiia bacterium]|nr:aminomethyl-transferring glycine dehydrogenase subunit GcvPA [Chlamydiia bacterium]